MSDIDPQILAVGLVNETVFWFCPLGVSPGLRGLLTTNNFLMGQPLSIYPSVPGPFFLARWSLGSVSGFTCLQSDLPKDGGIRFCAWLIFNPIAATNT